MYSVPTPSRKLEAISEKVTSCLQKESIDFLKNSRSLGCDLATPLALDTSSTFGSTGS